MMKTWNSSEILPQLDAGTVAVWSADLECFAGETDKLAAALAADEIKRAEKFRFRRHRDRFVAARGILRAILGCYLEIDPGQVVFTYNPHGKPWLSSDHAESLFFNISHSGNRALFAFSRDDEVGVDIERIKPDMDYDGLAGRFFSVAEAAGIRAMSAERKAAAFFACWTRKEAYVKAIGQGLSAGLGSFTVNVEPEHPARLVQAGGPRGEGAGWFLADLDAGEGYRATVAIQRVNVRLNQHRWGPADQEKGFPGYLGSEAGYQYE